MHGHLFSTRSLKALYSAGFPLFPAMCRLFVLFLALLLSAFVSRSAEEDSPDKALALACRTHSIVDAKAALQRGANPNMTLAEDDRLLLHSVLWQGNSELVKLLLKSGAKVNLEDSRGSTAISAAAGAYADGDSAVRAMNLRAIIAAGADVHHADRSGNNALVPAAGNDAGLTRILLDAGVKVSAAAVESAVRNYKLGCLEMLLKAGGDLHARLDEGRTMVHAACGWARAWDDEKQAADMLEKLHAAGLKVDVPDATGMTPLLLAAANANRGAAQWLIAHGADIKATDNAGRTALLAAVESHVEESPWIYHPLIAAGCPLDATGKAQVTALRTALHRQWWDTAHLLLAHGAATRDAASDLRSALSIWREFPAPPAATRGIFIRLLRRLPDARALTEGGFPLLRHLVFLGEPSLLKAVLRRGAEVNARDERGRTALMWASLTESEPALKLLRAAGADESLRDSDGKSAADLAALFHQPPAPPPASPDAPPRAPADLFDAVASADAAAVEKFVAAGKSSLTEERLGLRPVHLAALNNEPEITALLIKLGADPDIKSAEGVTPFAYAAAAGHATWCRWFIERADPAARPALIKEAAEIALKSYDHVLAAALFHAGWKPDADEAQRLLLTAVTGNDLTLTREVIPLCQDMRPQDGDPFRGDALPGVLDTAARCAGREVMECLLAATATPRPDVWRASVNSAIDTAVRQDKQQVFDSLLATGLAKEPLPLAVAYGRAGMVQSSLAQGHKPRIGDGLLRLALESGHGDLIPLLLKAGASVDEENKDGETALHLAARMGEEEMVQTLLAAGASLTVKTKSDQTAPDLAESEGFLDLADELRARAAPKSP